MPSVSRSIHVHLYLFSLLPVLTIAFVLLHPFFSSNVYTLKVYNAIFLIRSLVKFFTENLSEDQVSLQFSAPISVERTTDIAASRQGEVTTMTDKVRRNKKRVLDASVRILVFST